MEVHDCSLRVSHKLEGPSLCGSPPLQYPHVAAVYYSLYRLARYVAPPKVKRANWQWYLKQAVSAGNY